MSESTKRDRSANWEHNEKLLLKTVIKPYLKIVNSKELGTEANTVKKNAWLEITNKFNSINKIRYRKVNQLKTQWGVMKMNAKKERLQENPLTKGMESSTSSIDISESQESFESVPQERQCFKVESVEYEYECDSSEDYSNAGPIVSSQRKCQVLSPVPNTKEIRPLPCMVLNPLVVRKSFDEDYMPSSPVKEKPMFHVAVEVQKDPDLKEASTQTSLETRNNNNDKTKNGTSLRFPEDFYEDIRKYRDMENDRHEKEHLLRVKTIEEQHNQLMKNLQLQEEILKKQLNKLD